MVNFTPKALQTLAIVSNLGCAFGIGNIGIGFKVAGQVKFRQGDDGVHGLKVIDR
jgi:hypothetical protein